MTDVNAPGLLTFVGGIMYKNSFAKNVEGNARMFSRSTHPVKAGICKPHEPKLGITTMPSVNEWFYWALLSAVFASLTAIFAKIGLEGVDSDLATLIRTFVIIFVLAGFVHFNGKWSNPFVLSRKTWSFLVLSGLATGASWVCYFRALKVGEASKVAPVDKLSLVLEHVKLNCSRTRQTNSGRLVA